MLYEMNTEIILAISTVPLMRRLHLKASISITPGILLADISIRRHINTNLLHPQLCTSVTHPLIHETEDSSIARLWPSPPFLQVLGIWKGTRQTQLPGMPRMPTWPAWLLCQHRTPAKTQRDLTGLWYLKASLNYKSISEADQVC